MSIVKKGLLALLATVASTTAAGATEDWSGGYVGVDAGYAKGDSSANVALSDRWTVESAGLRSDVTRLWSTDLEPDGGSFGVHGGYNHQFANRFVLGGELSYDFMSLSASRALPQTVATSTPSITYAPSNSVDVNGAVTARARLGYAFEKFLGYVSIGYTSADVEVGAAILSNGGYSKAGSKSEQVSGVSYGLGAEYRLSGPWSVRGEYQRVDLDDVTFATAYRPGSTFVTPAYTETFTQDLSLDSFKIGVSYNF